MFSLTNHSKLWYELWYELWNEYEFPANAIETGFVVVCA